MANNPLDGAGYLLRGLGLIAKPGLRPFVLVPLAVNIVVFSLLIWLGVDQFELLMDRFLPSSNGWLAWLRWLLWPLFAIALVLIVFYTFTVIANLIAAPFNGLLAEKVERYLGGEIPKQPGGIYFGEPRGVGTLADGSREGRNTMVYSEAEIERIGRTGFDIARRRGQRLCSVDKANVLETSQLWREVMTRLAAEYPDVELSHMYVDNAAMQLVRAPKQFDVVVTENLFGDILSDCAAMLTGSIGMLPSASLNESGFGMYEPVHGSAPDIAGQQKANPLATLLSVAMLLRYSLGESAAADGVEQAVASVLRQGLRTADIAVPGEAVLGTAQMGDAVVAALRDGA